MVVRRRVRAVLLPLALYGATAGAIAFFLHNAETGSRGLVAKQALKIQIYDLNRELDAAKLERAAWERRLALLRSDAIDRDLLEDRARVVLGRVHKNDLVIVTGP